MNPDQTAPIGDMQNEHSLSMRLQIFKWATKTYIS